MCHDLRSKSMVWIFVDNASPSVYPMCQHFNSKPGVYQVLFFQQNISHIQGCQYNVFQVNVNLFLQKIFIYADIHPIYKCRYPSYSDQM